MSFKCDNDKHIFEESEMMTGGIVYTCKTCGLEVTENPLNGDFKKKYYGSLIAGTAYKWRNDIMNPARIAGFKLVYRSNPTLHIVYNGSQLTIQNRFRGNRDSTKTFPKDFLEKTVIAVSDTHRAALSQFLYNTDYSAWQTDPVLFDKLCVPGFATPVTLTCVFENGINYCSISPDPADIEALISIIKDIAGDQRYIPNLYDIADSPLPDAAPAVAAVPFTNTITISETSVLCPNCKQPVSISYNFCGNCGYNMSLAKRPN